MDEIYGVDGDGGGCEDMKGGQPISSDTADQASGE